MTREHFLLLAAFVAVLVIGSNRFHEDSNAESDRGTPLPLQQVVLGDSTIHLIGPVAQVAELESGLMFTARVDTGASRCSLHVEEWKIENELPTMEENVGKTIHFRLLNRRGESHWLSREIAEVANFRTSEEEEVRYLVPLTISHQGVEKDVLVSLNDRSHMDFAMLLGRNYLAGEFVVDVAQEPPGTGLLVSSR